jgi:hypothetical protein
MKPNTSERSLRLECLKVAAGLAMQLKLSPQDVIKNAKSYYEFLNNDAEPVERERNPQTYQGRVFNAVGDTL